jgi:hypothetical protein
MTARELIEKRKWKVFMLPEDELLNVLRGKTAAINIPKGAMLIRCGYRLEMAGFAILVVHESYPEVAQNTLPETIVLQFHTKEVQDEERQG